MVWKHPGAMGKCYGSVTVGSHGQIVIPAAARKELSVELGDKLLVFQGFQGNGLMLLKAEAVARFLRTMSERLSEFESRLKEAPAEEGLE